MKKYLLVEGITDVAFVKYVCLKKGMTKKFDDFYKNNNRYVFNDFIIVDLAGQDKLYTALTFLKEEIDDIDKIGIIQDADKDFNKSKEKVLIGRKLTMVGNLVSMLLLKTNMKISAKFFWDQQR